MPPVDEMPAYDDLLAHLEDYEELLKAARAVVEGRAGPFVAHAQGRPYYEVDAEALTALRAAVEASDVS